MPTNKHVLLRTCDVRASHYSYSTHHGYKYSGFEPSDVSIFNLPVADWAVIA